jgi:hypothetical protein
MTTTDAATKPLGRAQREQLDELTLRLSTTAMERGAALALHGLHSGEHSATAAVHDAAWVALQAYLAGLTDWGRE